MLDASMAGVMIGGGRERREGGNHTNQISVCLQIAFVHFLPYARHKPDLFQTIAQTYSKTLPTLSES